MPTPRDRRRQSRGVGNRATPALSVPSGFLPTNKELDPMILDALRDAPDGLTERGIYAVISSGFEPTNEDLDAMIFGALHDARAGLTEDGIDAVIALRQKVEHYKTLERLLLSGDINACVDDESAPLTVDNFWFIDCRIEHTVEGDAQDTGGADTK